MDLLPQILSQESLPEPVHSKRCVKPKPVRPLGTRPGTEIQSQKEAGQQTPRARARQRHTPLPAPTCIPVLLPRPGRQRKATSPHPHPSSLLPPSRWQPGSRTRASKSTFRAVGACLIIAENQREPGEETEEGQTEGRREGGRERDRTEGKAAETGD